MRCRSLHGVLVCTSLVCVLAWKVLASRLTRVRRSCDDHVRQRTSIASGYASVRQNSGQVRAAFLLLQGEAC